MPRGGARPGAGRPRKQPEADKKPVVKTEPPKVDEDGYKTDPNWPFGQQRPPEPEDLSNLTPLDYLLGIVRDPGKDEKLRIQAATIAAPYCHPKKGESSAKKDAAASAKAAAGSGRFGRRQPPALTAVQGGKSG